MDTPAFCSLRQSFLTLRLFYPISQGADLQQQRGTTHYQVLRGRNRTPMLTSSSPARSCYILFCLILIEREIPFAEKVQEEIHRVLGPDRLPTYEDRKLLPFTEAVIHEIQRFSSVVPQFPRSTVADTHFRGYFIPKVWLRASLKVGRG